MRYTRAALERWRRRPRAQAPQLRPAHAQEDDPPRAPLGPLDHALAGKVVVIDDWGWDSPSTKAGKSAIAALGIEGKVLVVVGRDESNAILSFRNLPEVQLLEVSELNAYDVLCNDWIVFSTATVPSGDAATKVERAAPAPKSAEAPAADASAAEAEADEVVEPVEPVATTTADEDDADEGETVEEEEQ